MSESSYTGIIKSISGLPVPERNNIAFHSKYDPLKEAKSFGSRFDNEKSFYIVGGLCGAYHIQELLDKNSSSRILAIENSSEDINFLSAIPQVNSVIKNKNVILSTPESLYKDILNNYLPALYGNARIIFLRSWETQFSKTAEISAMVIRQALNTVSNDFATQSRFGKIWQRNIFQNLSLAEESDFERFLTLPAHKTAAIIAAGPSLDKSISRLIRKRDEYFIIATDTAFSILTKSNITADAVVSVDGQMISHSHYIGKLSDKTLFAFDLCSCNAAVRKVQKSKAPFIFFETGHPLSVLAASYTGRRAFPHLNAGAGTVTVAAYSFAMAAGFSKTEFFGADFSYLNGKAYARGTYLDELYSAESNRLSPIETLYDSLLFRTELKQCGENTYTTELLESYKKSLEAFMKQEQSPEDFRVTETFSKKDFKSFINKMYSNQTENRKEYSNSIYDYALIPAASFFQRNASKEESFKLALTKTLLYTEFL